MKEYYFEPYPELTFSRDGTALSLICPWLALEVELEDSSLESIDLCLKKIKQKDFLDQQVQEFLAFFSDYPILYVKPSKEKIVRKELALPSGKYELLNNLEINSGNIPWGLLFVTNSWSIDLDKVLDFAYIGEGLYSPVAVFSYLNHFIFSQSDSGDDIHQKLELILARDEKFFFELMKTILRQSYHVTHSCDRSISPAISLAVETKDAIQRYVNSEKGHHNLILRSFQCLDENPIESCYLMPETIVSMELLECVAKRCVTSFACSISLFEFGGFNECDPMASLLRKSSKPEAAKGLEIHFGINENEGHALVGLEFAKLIQPITVDSVFLACLAVETQIQLGNKIQKNILEIARAYGY